MADLLKNPIFLDEAAAREWPEARVSANGRVCPPCGNADRDKITRWEIKALRLLRWRAKHPPKPKVRFVKYWRMR
jgi:hypothetical protein